MDELMLLSLSLPKKRKGEGKELKNFTRRIWNTPTILRPIQLRLLRTACSTYKAIGIQLSIAKERIQKSLKSRDI